MKVIPKLLGVWLLVALSLLAQNVFAQSADSELPVAFSGRIAGDDNTTRMLLNFEGKIRARAYYMDSPNRIVIDFNEVLFSLDEEQNLRARGLITDLQYGRISNGRSRVVLTLAKPSRIDASKVVDRDSDSGKGFRYLLDLTAIDDEEYAAPISDQRNTLGESGGKAVKGDRLKPTKGKREKFLVVLDPGHGGIDGGAVGDDGTKEKDLTLAFAILLRDQLMGIGDYDVQMTRDDDRFLTLKNRLAFAKRSEADLFISIHADSLKQKFVRGATIYTLSKKASDGLSKELAESENAVDLIAGVSLPEQQEEVTDILADLTTRETKRFSKRMSRFVRDNLKNRIRLIKNPERSAAFGVLKAPKIPSILFEMGYLSNIEDVNLLKSNAWRTMASEALVKAVEDFFEGRSK